MINILRVSLNIEELGKSSNLLVLHVVKTSFHDFGDEVHNGGKISLPEVLCLFIKREFVQNADRYLVGHSIRVGCCETCCRFYQSRREDRLAICNVLSVNSLQLFF